VKEGDHFGRPRCRWEDNIKKDVRELGQEGISWIDWQKVETSDSLL
jgi:hypothetical protein